MRGAFLAAPALGAMMISVGAVEARADLLDRVWARFGEVCGPVVSALDVEPGHFQSTLPPEFRITRSIDGHRVFVDQQDPDAAFSLHISRSDLAGMRHLDCTVERFSETEIDALGIAGTLQARLEADANVTVIGGDEEVLAASPNWAVQIDGFQGSIILEAAGLIPHDDFITHFDIHNHGMLISAQGRVPLEKVSP